MKVEHIQEPELEFGNGRHIDIRFGLMSYGPVDFARSQAPRQIRLGMVGTTHTTEAVDAWLTRCRDGISAKKSNQPNLFPVSPVLGRIVASMPHLRRSRACSGLLPSAMLTESSDSRRRL
jgi:hypothetical protein